MQIRHSHLYCDADKETDLFDVSGDIPFIHESDHWCFMHREGVSADEAKSGNLP